MTVATKNDSNGKTGVSFVLPELPYSYDALEPHFDKQTMEIHHSKHHQAYTNNFNAALEKHPELFEKSAEEILANLNTVPNDIKTAVGNHGGGFLNHAFFWTILGKDVPFEGKIADAITKTFGGFEGFKSAFTDAATKHFGSGWAWLAINNGKLEIIATVNQDTPISEGKTPLLCLDVWEHAYYLKYQNRRPDFIKAFFSVINWKKVNEYYANALK